LGFFCSAAPLPWKHGRVLNQTGSLRSAVVFGFLVMAISLSWSACHLVALGNGWWRVVGVPEHQTKGVCTRVLELGVKRAKVIKPGVVVFREAAGGPAQQAIMHMFPCCPLSFVLAA
jgi:hypothetical protein